MLAKSPERIAKPNKAEKKDKLLSFFKRHDSLTRMPSNQKNSSLKSTPKRIKKEKSSLSSRKNLLPSKRKSSARETYPEITFSTPCIPKEIPEAKEKNYLTDIMIENWKESLILKENELIRREKQIIEQEKINEKIREQLKEKANKIKERENDLNIKENDFLLEKEKMLKEISLNLEKKSIEIIEREKQINKGMMDLEKKFEELNKTKEELIKFECSALINELINKVIEKDNQHKLKDDKKLEKKLEKKNNIDEENTLTEIVSSINDTDIIDDLSSESSFEESSDNFSSNYLKRRNKIIQECDEISKENSKISEKLETLFAKFKLSANLNDFYKNLMEKNTETIT